MRTRLLHVAQRLPTAFLFYSKLVLGFHGTPHPHNLIINPSLSCKQTFERNIEEREEEEG